MRDLVNTQVKEQVYNPSNYALNVDKGVRGFKSDKTYSLELADVD